MTRCLNEAVAGWRKGTAAAGGARGETPTSNVRAVWGSARESGARRSNAEQSSVLPVKLYPPGYHTLQLYKLLSVLLHPGMAV